MIKSMTGYGRAQDIVNGMNITVELKSVNHRYFEFSPRISRNFGFLEDPLKKYIQTRVNRGKLDCYVSIEILEAQPTQVIVNHPLAAGYIKALTDLAETYDLRNDISAVNIARYPDVLTVKKEAEDEEEIFNSVKCVAEKALDRFIEMREREGQRLRDDVLSRAETIRQRLAFIESQAPVTLENYTNRLRQKIEDLLNNKTIDEQRLLTEVAIFADKIAIDEETVRLHSHLNQLDSMMNSDESIGRKLDFLVQEINRETNTIGSKSQDVDILKSVIEIKAEVEKIREQIQNIE